MFPFLLGRYRGTELRNRRWRDLAGAVWPLCVPPPSPNIDGSALVSTILADVKCVSFVFIYIPWWLVMLSTFSSVYGQFINPLLWDVQIFAYFLKNGLFVLFVSYECLLCILDTSPLSDVCSEYFLPVCGLPFHFLMVSFDEQKFKSWWSSNYWFFSFIVKFFFSEKFLLALKELFSCFLTFMFRPIIHLVFISVSHVVGSRH